MALEAAYILPHPPLAVHEVGRGREMDISSTLDGYEEVARRVDMIAPDKIVFISPHAAYYADWIYIAGGAGAEGDLASFGAPQVRFSVEYDDTLRSRIESEAARHAIPAGPLPGGGKPLDHGTIVPLYFLEKEYPSDRFTCVLVGGSALPREMLVDFGRCIADACEQDGSRCVLLVSGDLSHKLEASGPYGFDPAGPVFDEAFVDVVEGGEPMRFASIDRQVCEDAAECGLSGFIMMAGALERAAELAGAPFGSELISHEGPFGVGYGVAAFERIDTPVFGGSGASASEETSASTLDDVSSSESDVVSDPSSVSSDGVEAAEDANAGVGLDGAKADPLVELAERTIRRYVTDGTVPTAPDLPRGLPERAGCFVSIHTASTGDLRGCIGTIEPVQASLADEVITNAVSASTRDPRFNPIVPAELDDLEINVDVLYPPEPSRLDQMDASRYGIIVEQGWKRGLLLPDLDGIDTVQDQYRIACMKAGIDPATSPDEVEISRFEVERHR